MQLSRSERQHALREFVAFLALLALIAMIVYAVNLAADPALVSGVAS